MRLIRTGIILFLFSLLLSGCGFYSGVEKDKVMVKKIETSASSPPVQYEGTLSEGAYETLGLNAINSFYGHNLTSEDILMEGSGLDLQQIKAIIASTQASSDPGNSFLVQYKDQLSRVEQGVYLANIVNKYEREDAYGVVFNAKNGEVLGLYRLRSSSTTLDKTKTVLGMEELKEKAGQSLPSVSDAAAGELELVDESIVSDDRITEFDYRSKESGSVVLSLLLDRSTGELDGYYKDIMSVIQYLIARTKYATSVIEAR
ncbi:hypothetical protein [Cohnella sp. AR92]|uniref:hypothetical protein n=1 Tax=Cohnella sp. AR92 TaxID=648716 RepID=UPI000F8E01B4|nr:hypothetical protein [Cohnella sp. AR92]RUS45953.1 hypothetical protein ELR57_16005 [Cohnella sp. AR92]